MCVQRGDERTSSSADSCHLLCSLLPYTRGYLPSELLQTLFSLPPVSLEDTEVTECVTASGFSCDSECQSCYLSSFLASEQWNRMGILLFSFRRGNKDKENTGCNLVIESQACYPRQPGFRGYALAFTRMGLPMNGMG